MGGGGAWQGVVARSGGGRLKGLVAGGCWEAKEQPVGSCHCRICAAGEGKGVLAWVRIVRNNVRPGVIHT